MALFFPILLLVIGMLVKTGLDIFSEIIFYIVPILSEYRHAIDLGLGAIITFSMVWIADVVAIKSLSHAFASVLRKNPLAQKLLPIMKFIVRIVIWAIGLFIIISGFGYDITNLLAGTGFIGIGAALAGKEMVGNLLGSLSLVFGKYFKIGDTIRVKKDFEGEVVEISLSRTKLIDADGVSIYIPNKFLISEAIENKSEGWDKK